MLTRTSAAIILALLPAAFTATVPSDICVQPQSLNVGEIRFSSLIEYREESYPTFNTGGPGFNVTTRTGPILYCRGQSSLNPDYFYEFNKNNITCVTSPGEATPEFATNFTYVQDTDPKKLELFKEFECGESRYVAGGVFEVDLECTRTEEGTLGEPNSSVQTSCGPSAPFVAVLNTIEKLE